MLQPSYCIICVSVHVTNQVIALFVCLYMLKPSDCIICESVHVTTKLLHYLCICTCYNQVIARFVSLYMLQPSHCMVCLFVCFCCLTSHVNSYGHCGTVSSLSHTFSWAGLSKRLTSNLCTYFCL